MPYGTRGRDIITKYARQDVAFLRQYDLKSIIIACNTVSAIALDLLSEENDIPIIGTVEPACRRAMTMTQTGRVGVIGTAATIRSGAYEKYLHKKDGTLDLFTQACPLFVPLVENGRVHRGDVVIETVVKEYLTPLKDAGVDTLILGCTHYPVLAPLIQQAVGENVSIISSSEETAKEVVETLTYRGHLADGSLEQHSSFYTTGEDLDDFRNIGGHIFGYPIDDLSYVDIEDL